MCIKFCLEEDDLQECVIRPTEDNKMLTNAMCTALKLLLRLIRFENRLFKVIDYEQSSFGDTHVSR